MISLRSLFAPRHSTPLGGVGGRYEYLLTVHRRPLPFPSSLSLLPRGAGRLSKAFPLNCSPGSTSQGDCFTHNKLGPLLDAAATGEAALSPAAWARLRGQTNADGTPWAARPCARVDGVVLEILPAAAASGRAEAEAGPLDRQHSDATSLERQPSDAASNPDTCTWRRCHDPE